jgi:iron complex transport system ATP-binding protein
MTDVVLAAEGVAHAYGARPVLAGVDVALARGEIVGLIGPNGAGKTTLVRVLAGLLPPDHGRVTLQGRAIGAWDARGRARAVAFVPQDPHVEFPFRVLEVALMGRAPHLTGLGFAGPDDLHRTRGALARLGVTELEARRIESLSGGERQRVFLARALAQDAPVLLLDEPTTHLDVHHQVEILEVVRERVREGGAALAVLHDLNLAAVACDRLVLLAGGRVAASGPASAVLTAERLAGAFQGRLHVGRHDGAGVPAVLPPPMAR